MPNVPTILRDNAWFLAIIAALALAAGVALTTDRANADEPAVALLETQIAGDIESAKRQTTPLQWGGGSLYRLKMRLATKGCILDLVWAYDTPSRTWYFYNQYHIPYSFNESFLNRFETFVPAGTIWVQCFDRCEFSDDGSYANPDTGRAPSGKKDCVSFWEEALWSDGTGNTRFQELGHHCTYDFHSILKEKLFPILPIIPGLCVIRNGAVVVDQVYTLEQVRSMELRRFMNQAGFQTATSLLAGSITLLLLLIVKY